MPRSPSPLGLLGRASALMALAAASTACASTPDEVVPPSTIRGQYIFQDGSHLIRPCGNQAPLWVVGSEEVLEPLRTRSTAHSMALGVPNQGVYAEITGTLESSDAPGYAQKLRAVEATRLDDHLPDTCAVPNAATG
ncbi:hypothetical protein [Marilutibacter aestuarii]|uniref:NlpE C-terminal OB domain-containing protein n=1 Tax=Marilutibacter aestuarii TaxID=1706195 RepID=A0A508A3P3_9GAMM|nr:hypothetical protein [Lysobacter aestuarii]TQD43361.1 hypothetical protein FKV25_10675 [Lysobacter aestuarii]